MMNLPRTDIPKLFLLLLALLLAGLYLLYTHIEGTTINYRGLSIAGDTAMWLIVPLALYAYASSFFFILSWTYRDPYLVAKGELVPENRRNPLVSLLVAVKNEERLIVDCVNSMLAQTHANREIFVVDDGSDDGTSRVLKREFGDNPEIRLVTLEVNVGKKAALARALEEAKGEILAFTDSDSIWEPEAIERVVAIFENQPEVGAVCGHCSARNADENVLTHLQDAWNQKQYRLRKGFESIFGVVSCVSGPLACYRRAAIYNYIPAWENDTFLGTRFRMATDRTLTGFTLGGARLGPTLKEAHPESPFVTGEDHPCRDWEVVYSSSARVTTIVPDTPRSFFTQRIRWGKSFIRTLFLTGRFYWRRASLPALFYYLHILYVFTFPAVTIIIPIWLVAAGLWRYAALYLLVIGALYPASVAISKVKSRRAAMWLGRPILGLFALVAFPWFMVYSALTIRRMTWQREAGAEPGTGVADD